MPEKNLVSWNAVISGLTQHGFHENGLHYFSEMRNSGLIPDQFTLGSALKGCSGIGALKLGQQIHGNTEKLGFQSNLFVGSSLSHMYMKCGVLDEGERVFRAMPIHNVVSCNTVIAVEAQNGQSDRALDYSKKMNASGLMLDRVTFVSVIISCAELATLGQGQQAHCHQAIKAGVDLALSLRSSLVGMYSKCGCLA
ncbi:hypothetical protein AMTRI_Chr07g27350 [Amborella trichopoda]